MGLIEDICAMLNDFVVIYIFPLLWRQQTKSGWTQRSVRVQPDITLIKKSISFAVNTVGRRSAAVNAV